MVINTNNGKTGIIDSININRHAKNGPKIFEELIIPFIYS